MADADGSAGGEGERGSGHHHSPVQRVSSDPSLSLQPPSHDPSRVVSSSRVAVGAGGSSFSSHVGMRANPLYNHGFSPSPSLDMGASGGSSSSAMRIDSIHDIAPLNAMTPQQWSRYMKSEIASAQRPLFRRSKIIFPVPKALHEVRPQAYYPRLLSIGPIHARRLAASPMDRCKALCVKEFLRQSSNTTQLQDLISTLFCLGENPAGANYYGIPKYDKDTLELLISIDSVFVLEFMRFLLTEDTEQRESDEDQPNTSSYMWDHIHNHLTVSQILRDLFLVGNQVPLSNVVRLAEYQDRREELLLALEYTIWRCSPFINISPESNSHFKEFRKLLGAELFECEHLLDCLYLACVKKTRDLNPKKTKNKGSSNSRGSSTSVSIKTLGVGESSLPKKLDRIPRVSELRKVGVKFKGVIGNTSTVGYDKNKLLVKLPKLVVYDETECTLRNLVAYELTSKEEGEICAYVMLMDSLVDTSDDLAILYKAGVLENHLGSDEKLLCMWNDMCVNITEANSKRLDEMTRAIMIHYKTNWRVIYVEFHHLFLSRPWLLLSTVAAVLLLFMTALQTVYSVVGFYKV